MIQLWWSDFKLSAIEFRKTLERDRMLHRYQKWAQGQSTWDETLVDSAARLKEKVVTSWRYAFKRTMDFTISLAVFLLALPVMAFIALAIRLETKGPVIYSQIRVGMRGRLFNMLKFRTMVQDAEVKSGPVWAKANDPRITRVGRFLRKTHLDELPQLFNVISGEMSLVGPRPERPYFVNEFRKIIPHYDRRLCAKPGITGLAQIKRRYDESIADVRQKVRYDVLYIQKMCPLLDVKVMALTALAVVMRTGR